MLVEVGILFSKLLNSDISVRINISKGVRIPFTQRKDKMNAVVDVDSVTRLDKISETDGITQYAEVYHGFKTGNTFEYASTAHSEEVRQAYKDKSTATAKV